MAQHVADVIAFIEQLDPKPVDLMSHSRGGHIAIRLAQQRPDLLRRLVLAEPGGNLDASLDPTAAPSVSARVVELAEMVKAGDIEGALKNFFEAIEGDGTWARLPAAAKQQLRDNAITLVGQIHENRKRHSKAEAQSITRRRRCSAAAATPRTVWQQTIACWHRMSPARKARSSRIPVTGSSGWRRRNIAGS